MKLGSLLAVALLLAACAGTREAVRPVGAPATARAPEGGARAAVYPILSGGRLLGEARVWSLGVVAGGSKTGRTAIDIAFEIHNRSELPMTVALDHVNVLSQAADTTLAIGDIAEVEGSLNVAPGHRRTARLRLPLPVGMDPQLIDGFRVEWHVRSGEAVFAVSTSFVEEVPELLLNAERVAKRGY